MQQLSPTVHTAKHWIRVACLMHWQCMSKAVAAVEQQIVQCIKGCGWLGFEVRGGVQVERVLT